MMEERILNECLDANPTSSIQGDGDHGSLPHQKMSTAETSCSPFTRAQARRGIPRLSGPPRQPKLLPRMHRRFLKSKPTDRGLFKFQTDSQVNAPVLRGDEECRLEINLGRHMGSVEEEGYHANCSSPKPQLRDLNFVLIDTEAQDTVRGVNDVKSRGPSSCYHAHQESYTSLLCPRASHHSSPHVASSGFGFTAQHAVQPNHDVVATTMHSQTAVLGAVSGYIMEATGTQHDFTFQNASSCQPNQGWDSVNPTEDFLQLACFPLCMRNPDFGGGNSLPCDVTCGSGGATRPHGKSPVNVLMERRRSVPGNTFNLVSGQPGITACNCPVRAGFRWNTAEASATSFDHEVTTSPANSRNMAKKGRGRHYVPTKGSREPSFSNMSMATAGASLRGSSPMNERDVRHRIGRYGKKRENRGLRKQRRNWMYGRECNTAGSPHWTAASESAGCVGEHEPTNFEEYLANIRFLEDALLGRQCENAESDKENVSPPENNLEVHVRPAERQPQCIFADVSLAVVGNNEYDGRRQLQDKRLEGGEGRSPPRGGNQIIDVNRLPDEDGEGPPEMRTWVEMFGELGASERRCQNLLEDNDNLRQLNLSLTEQLISIVDTYKAMLSDNASLMDKLRRWRTQELDRILDACGKWA